MNTQSQVERPITDDNGGVAPIHDLPALWLKDDIKKDQDKIKKSLSSVQASIHMNALQCMMHAEKHGDTSLMRRLLVDIVNKDTMIRQQGIIGWMRMFSPMELIKDNVNLSGTDAKGNKRPWKLKEAAASPFTTIRSLDEKLARPIYRDALLSPIQRQIQAFKAAAENTSPDGKPIDKTKAFYDGINITEVQKAFEKFETNLVELQSWRDPTKAKADAQAAVKKANDELKAVELSAKGELQVA